jgi:hypothetical protein
MFEKSKNFTKYVSIIIEVVNIVMPSKNSKAAILLSFGMARQFHRNDTVRKTVSATE